MLESTEHNYTDKTDEEIILSYRAGNETAFKALIDRYTKPLYNFIARIASKNDAGDIVQEIFIKVWKNISRFNPSKASFKTWVFTIAKNSATDFLRKKKSILFSDIENKNDDDANSFAENIPDEDLMPDIVLQQLQEKAEGEKILNEALEKLRPDYREVLVLHYQEEMTFEEIGKVLDKPLHTVKSQHRRAIMELRKLIT